MRDERFAPSPSPRQRSGQLRWIAAGVFICVLAATVMWGTLWAMRGGIRRNGPSSGPAAADVTEVTDAGDIRVANQGSSGKESLRTASAGQRDDTATDTVAATTAVASIAAPSTSEKLRQLAISLDAAHDGWQSEVWSDRATEILKSLTHQVEAPPADSASVAKLPGVSAQFEAFLPTDEARQPVFRSREIQVDRSPWSPAAIQALGLPEFLDGCRRQVSPTTELRSKVKLFGIQVSESGTLETQAYVEWSGKTKDRRWQRNAEWHCEWQRDGMGELQLRRLEVRDLEEKSTEWREGWFTDRTAELLQGVTSYGQQLRRGANFWVDRIEERLGFHDSFRNGIAVGDANGDDLEDLYVCQTGGLPNRLYVQTPDGRAMDISHEAGVDWLDLTSAALFLDLDNDGDQDLLIAIPFRLLILENDGTAHFRVAAALELEDEDVKSLCAADYDHDGDLDIYVCVDLAHHAARPDETRPPFAYHDANDGGRNVLFESRWQQGGSWTFVDVTSEVGLDVRNRRHSLAAAWEDFDNDGDQDLYVANDYGKNCLYRNDQGHFVEVAEDYGVVDAASGMSVTWGDYDQSGTMDLYVANMWSSAGGRVTQQEGFQTHATAETRAAYRRFAKGNTLLSNRGDRFDDVGEDAGVQMGRWAWSSLFVDLNNDSWQDLVIANGYLTTGDTGDL